MPPFCWGLRESTRPGFRCGVVGYQVGRARYWVATDRHDLAAEQVALAYKLRWSVESFFAWWKRHLKVYHILARSRYGLMVQILAGLITYLLLAIHCWQEHQETVSIKRVRELRFRIKNEHALESRSCGHTLKARASPKKESFEPNCNFLTGQCWAEVTELEEL